MSDAITRYQTSSQQIATGAQESSVETPEDLQKAGEVVTAIKTFVGAVEAHRGEQTSPMYKQIREIEAQYRPVLKQCNEAMQTVQQKMLAFRALEEQRRQAAMLAAPQAPTPQAFQALVVQGAAVAPHRVAGVVFAEAWVFDVVDVNLIPREYWMLDTEKIQKAVEEQKSIPGVNARRTERVGQVRRAG